MNCVTNVQRKISQATPLPRICTAIAWLGWVALLSVPCLAGADSRAAPPSISTATLSADQIVDNLVRKNQERAQSLAHFEGTRIYHLAYRGFPGDRDAEMTVTATYDSPCSKKFQIVSESGSKLVLTRVFKKLLESEKEAIQPAMAARTQLNRDNYTFELVRYEPSSTGGQYVLRVNPKSRSKFLYRGTAWVDGVDFAVTHLEVEPAENPSFWTKKNEIRHEYKKVGEFWLPARNESVSCVRLGGRATLTIEYTDYRVSAAGSNERADRIPASTGSSEAGR